MCWDRVHGFVVDWVNVNEFVRSHWRFSKITQKYMKATAKSTDIKRASLAFSYKCSWWWHGKLVMNTKVVEGFEPRREVEAECE
jgi:hypothetical protein